MNCSVRSNTFQSIFFALLVLLAFDAVAVDCPADAICRYDLEPGKYSDKGPYRYDDYDMPFGSTPGGASVYYPTNAEPPFSVLVFTPPLSGTQIMYRAWGPFFASHGIVMVTMDTRTTLDQVDSRARQQKTVLDAMKEENTRMGSPLYGKVATDRLGAVGWSMGGGATWINSAEYDGLRTAMSLAGHNLTAIDLDSKGYGTRCPTILFNGALDVTILGGLGQSDGVYDNIPSGVPKLIYEVVSAGHFSWGTPTQANDYVAELALAFQKTFLDGDLRWADYLTRPIRDVAKFESANLP
ncbi:dienelactone hydrolase family protein [Gynuella sunshinyii]|uniref:Dienelactone hydrolase-related enzyme n=1 Tax=Gynuella sunshinyii YC6258 TaxID=1445510 RepID=A0A0C5VU99_9GAMM|nr:alpha/beta hydrolase [Gynuella sunshinyii]AJQ93984.1 dienelactone hydrolase-related enzyme [Gynuella sunshinyii YC6258]